MTHETPGRRALVGRRLLVTLFGLLLIGAAAAGAVLFWTGDGGSTSAVASPPPLVDPAEPFGTIIFQGVVDRLGVPQLRTVSLPNGEPKSLRGRRFHGVEPTFSRDGRFVAFGQWITRDDDRGGRHGNTLVVARSDGSQARVVIPHGTNDFVFHNASQWSHDGSRIAVVSSDYSHPDSTLNSVAARGGPLRKLGKRELEWWAPPNAGRAVEQAGPHLSRIAWFTAGGTKPIALIENASQPVWSPTRPEFAYVIGRRLFIFDTLSQRSRRVARSGCFSRAGRPAWSPDGDWLAHFRCPPKRSPDLRIVSRDGKQQRVLLRDVVGGYSPSWRR